MMAASSSCWAATARDRKRFRQFELAGRVANPLSRPNEQLDIFLCRQLTVDLRAIWTSLKG
jgi:hypothetical protein